MADDIAQWLEGLGLGRHAQAFADNGIDLDILSSLTEDDFKDLGLNLGDRRRIQRALHSETPRLNEPAGSRVTKEQIASVPEAERRQLTVLFCDLVGSTALATRLDPEDMRDVLRGYQEACAGVIVRYDGYVAKFMGDGVYAYFGYPRAHEDDAERAINAGLGIVETIRALANNLRVRIGIATGTVAVGDIVGEGSAEEANVVGEAPNLAARLQELAEPDAVLIGEATHALAGGLFETSSLGRRDLKGFNAPAAVWRVHRSRRTESRFEATRGEHLTELIGRDEELEVLLRRWRRAKAGEGQVVLISGEPGIGKSRLARELQGRIADDAHVRLNFQCSPYHTNTALHTVTEQLERAARFESGDVAAVRLDKLERLLSMSNQAVERVVPLFAALLSLPVADHYTPLNMSPQRQRELTLNALVEQLSGLAARQPVLLIFEDAHWIDPTTLEWMELVVELIPEMAVMAIITYRPEFDPPWVGRPRITPMILGRLERRDCAILVEKIGKQEGIAQELRDRIADQTDGVPLFIEELTKAVLEAGGQSQTGELGEGGLAGMAIPATLQDTLEARLDRLGTPREVVQIGAGIGRTFDYDLLSRIVSLDGSALDAALDELVRSDLLKVRGTPPDARYAFKHALVQDTAYRSLLRGPRAELHGRIAAALEESFPEMVEHEPETLAHHHTAAGHVEVAVAYWQRAGERAAERSADVEANRHLQQALQMLEDLPESEERWRRELEILIARGPILMNLQGSASSEVRDAYVRARELCDRSAQPRQRFPVLWGLWLNHHIGGDAEAALELAHEAIGLAEDLSDRDLLLQAHHAAWTSQMGRADFCSVVEHADQGLALYDLDRHRAQIFTYGGHDAGVCAGALSAHAQWFIGFADQALERSHNSVALARRTDHPFSIAQAMHYGAMLRMLRREPADAAEISKQLIEFSAENGLAIWRANGAVLQGWARSVAEPSAEELNAFREAVSEREKTGSRLRHAIHLAALAHALSLMGEDAEARQTIEQALREADRTGERSWDTLIHWFNGEVLNAGSDQGSDLAEACYQRAFDVARRQRAKTMELRAATSLARIEAEKGREREARELLTPVYGWFTEGFDTADLKVAKSLLDALS